MTAPEFQDAELGVVECLDDCLEVKRWLGERRDVLAVDTETGGLEWWRQPLRLVVLGDERTGWSIPWDLWAGLVHETLGNYTGPTVYHNAKFDLHVLETHGVPLRRETVNDTVIASHLLEPRGHHGLKQLANKHVDSRSSGGQAVLNDTMEANGWDWGTVPIDFPPYWQYASLDAVLTARLWAKLEPEIPRALYELETRVQLVLTDMERRGARVDHAYIAARTAAFQQEEEEARAFCRAEWDLNPASDPQVRKRLLLDGVVLTERTDTGQFSVKGEVLEQLDHPLAAHVLKVREVHRNWKTYLGGLTEFADGDVVHCGIRALGARTGRMSISDPPLQQMPRGPEIRDAFIPRDGHVLISADYDQVELRLLAHFAQERNMIDAVLRGDNLHTETARLVFGTDDPTKDQYQIAKSGNFAKVYGSGAETFGRTVGMPVPDAEEFMRNYDSAFPGIASFMIDVEKVLVQRRREGLPYVKTWAGRTLPVETYKLYSGVNYLIQGSACDVFKRALVDLDAAGFGEYMVLPIHDECLFDVPAELAADVAHDAAQVMSDTTNFAVPLSASADVMRERWGDKFR